MAVWSTGIGTRPIIFDFMKQIGQDDVAEIFRVADKDKSGTLMAKGIKVILDDICMRYPLVELYLKSMHMRDVLDLLKNSEGNPQKESVELDIEQFKNALANVDSQVKTLPPTSQVILHCHCFMNEDGDSIEPMWYIPIIPMVLVNGSQGIGTGCSSFVPNYNPKDIIANVRRIVNDEPMQSMDPWYRVFKVLIENSVKETGATYTITGIIEEVDSTTLRITELPIRKWTLEYKQFLESMIAGDDKIK